MPLSKVKQLLKKQLFLNVFKIIFGNDYHAHYSDHCSKIRIVFASTSPADEKLHSLNPNYFAKLINNFSRGDAEISDNNLTCLLLENCFF